MPLAEFPEYAEDIGGGHAITYLTAHDGDGTRVGIIDWHRRPDDVVCGGAVPFAGRWSDLGDRPAWTIENEDPLTLSPSILCSPDKGGCGAHGFIRDGRWVAA